MARRTKEPKDGARLTWSEVATVMTYKTGQWHNPEVVRQIGVKAMRKLAGIRDLRRLTEDGPDHAELQLSRADG